MDSCPRYAARPYVSPRERDLSPEEAETRRLAYALLWADPVAVAVAAREMAPLLPVGCRLVPVPASSCDISANLRLAEALAVRVRGQVVLALGRLFPVESSRLRRLRGAPPLPMEARGFRATVEASLLAGPVAFVDNVTVSGLTFLAARQALGRGFGVAFATAAAVRLRCHSALNSLPGLNLTT